MWLGQLFTLFILSQHAIMIAVQVPGCAAAAHCGGTAAQAHGEAWRLPRMVRTELLIVPSSKLFRSILCLAALNRRVGSIFTLHTLTRKSGHIQGACSCAA